jgi:hypothetical protein
MNRRGFTSLEVVVALFIVGLLLVSIWGTFQSVDETQRASFHEADRRGAGAAVRDALGRALARAGHGMAGSANLAGFHVQAGTDTDTLYIFEAAGSRARLASRECRSGERGCVVLMGDRRSEFVAGTLLVLGSEAAGLVLRFVAANPVAFSDTCGSDCIERILCAFAGVPTSPAPDVAGSVRTPAGGGAGTPSPEPCPQPYLADGTRCEENPTTVAVAAVAADRCVAARTAATFTEVRTTEAGGAWGLPAPGVPVALRSGGGVAPAPMAQPVAAARYWTRTSDSTLIREREPLPDGGWRRADRVGGPVLDLRGETLHAGETSWRPGIGITSEDLSHSGANPNFYRSPPGTDAPRAWSFRRGDHTVAAARVRYTELQPVGADSVVGRRAALVQATPALRAGARPEDSQ